MSRASSLGFARRTVKRKRARWTPYIPAITVTCRDVSLSPLVPNRADFCHAGPRPKRPIPQAYRARLTGEVILLPVPSPVGHALGGIAAGWGSLPRRDRAAAAILAAVAVAPDLDLLVHDHRGFSHSLGAALIAGVVAWLVTRRAGWAVAVTAAWGSHVLLDWLSHDTRPPLGVMALWPFTRDYYKSSLELFPAVSRRYWLAEFWIYNLRALLVELIVVGPIAALAVWRARRST
jgi:inner membrane protein